MTIDERQRCWAEFERATRERGHAFRQPVVMSVDEEGYPSGRVLTLREAMPREGRMRFHIDRRSPKFGHWHSKPVVGAVFYDGPRKWQIRMRGVADLHYDNEIARAAWENSHPMSRRTYMTTAAPGEELDWEAGSTYPPGFERRRPTDEECAAAFGNFAVLLVDVLELDSLHLAGVGHERFHILDETHKVRRLAP